MAGRKQAGPRPECPRPEHKGSNVRRYGFRGPVGHKRPRWKCVPSNGDRPHEFSEVLPRQTTSEGFCIECERDYAHHEGPQSARYYGFAIREIAAALIRVGQGASYCEAASFVRGRADRWPVNREGVVRLSRHGQLVGDWVEVFAPIVYEPYQDSAWPTTGSVLLDELPFVLRRTARSGSTVPLQAGASFSILAAMGWDKDLRRMRLYKLEAVAGHRATQRKNWEGFLQGLTGEPRRVVCDQGHPIIRAVGSIWPEARIHHCEYHLKQRCYYHLTTVGLHIPGTPAYDFVERAFDSISTWERFKQEWLRTKKTQLRKHIRHIEPLVLAQLGTKPPYPDTRNPFTTGALEETLNWLRNQLDMRAATMTNRERLNRALLLMQLERNARANEAAYARGIHKWLLNNEGRPTSPRRRIVDHNGELSLRH